ncbi:MAG: hypothetical protein H0T76_16230 [Nannocystis sp.]|nr:hypothetical protein [Nannocystis sp.]MBA3548029.1 hypothetical protein [Nannocystis sp.]
MAGILSAALALPADAAASPADIPPAAPADIAPAAPPAASSPTAPPTDQAEALRLFRAARVLYNAGEFREAARGFESSFAAAPSPESAYNAALAHERVGDRVATLRWFRRYLAVARRDTDPSYPLAVTRADELSAGLGELSLRIDQPEQLRELRVNGVVVALEDFPLLLEPGPVELRVLGERPDQVVTITSEIPAGGPATIHFPGFTSAPDRPDPPPVEPVKSARPPRTTGARDPRELPRHRTLQGLFWAGASLTGGSAIAVGVLGGLTLRARNNYEADYVPIVPKSDQGAPNRAAQQRLHDLRLSTNVMIGVATGLAVITLALGIVTLQNGRRLRSRARTGRLRLAAGGLQLAF